MSVAEFERIQPYVTRSRLVEELTDEEIAMVARSEVPAEYDYLDALLDD